MPCNFLKHNRLFQIRLKIQILNIKAISQKNLSAIHANVVSTNTDTQIIKDNE